jgi:hypothetical protein
VRENGVPSHKRWLTLIVLLLASSCAKQELGGPPPSPESIPALQLDVLTAVGGRLDYCDPDQYPIAHGRPIDNARERLPIIQTDAPAYAAILDKEGLSAGQDFTDDELIAINEDYKQLQAIRLQASGALYSFSVLVPKSGAASGNETVSGTVSTSGSVTITTRGPGQRLNCPICLAAGDRIATPEGDVRVQDLRPGMAVWTTDRSGRRITAVVLEVGSMQAPIGHEVVRIGLADGRAFVASPGHPTAEGRTVGDLRPGDLLDGSRVISATLVGYAGVTYDLLPSGPTGTYFVNGVLLGSTLFEQS